MRVDLDDGEMRSLVEAAVHETVRQLANRGLLATEQLAVTELRAAELLGVPRHVLRDARLRGEIAARRIGRRYIYAIDNLRRYVAAHTSRHN